MRTRKVSITAAELKWDWKSSHHCLKETQPLSRLLLFSRLCSARGIVWLKKAPQPPLCLHFPPSSWNLNSFFFLNNRFVFLPRMLWFLWMTFLLKQKDLDSKGQQLNFLYQVTVPSKELNWVDCRYLHNSQTHVERKYSNFRIEFRFNCCSSINLPTYLLWRIF